MSHKYLEKIPAAIKAYTAGTAADDYRQERWATEREEYSFDERETWNLNSTFYAWLYEHLQMYKERAGKMVNLEYHTFEYEGKTYTQLEMIDQICEMIEFFFSSEFEEWDEKCWKYVSNIERMWAVVMPTMWW